jgi:hypothetical protein
LFARDALERIPGPGRLEQVCGRVRRCVAGAEVCAQFSEPVVKGRFGEHDGSGGAPGSGQCWTRSISLQITRAASYLTNMRTVKVSSGRVEEYENGSLRRTFGSNIVSAATDGQTTVAVTSSGRVEEYVNGSLRRTYGSNARSAQVSGDTVAVQTANGRTEEYVNGSLRRTY